MLLNERIKNLRLENKYTQRYVFTKIDVTQNAYQSIEYGTSKPKVSTLISIANLYDVSIDYLVGRTNIKNSHKLTIDQIINKE